MTWSPRNRRFWPEPSHERLLHAALDDGLAAIAAWTAWQGEQELDRIDLGSFRILPLVWKNLKRLGVVDRWSGRMAGVYRQTWARNRLAARRLAEFINAVSEPVMLLKGSALAVAAYRDWGLRPMDDFDVLIRHEHVAAAEAALRRLAWKCDSTIDVRTACDGLPVDKCSSWRHPDGVTLELHWDVFAYCHVARPAPIDFGWKHAQPIELEGSTAWMFDATDLLLHVCTHGREWSEIPPCHWVADAVLLLRHADFGHGIDWGRLLATADHFKLSTGLLDAVVYVEDRFGPLIPDNAARRIAAARPDAEDQRLDRQRTAPIRSWRSQWSYWRRHYRTVAAQGGRPADSRRFVQYWLRFYRETWGCSGSLHLARKTLARFFDKHLAWRRGARV